MTEPIRPCRAPRPGSARGFTLVEVMIVVLIIGILLVIAVPSIINSRETSRSKSCVANLYEINSAKQQSAMDNKLSDTSTATFSIDGTTASTATQFQLVGTDGYVRATPVCPSAGTYTPGGVNAAPTCTLATNASAGADYQPGGRWYHGY